MMRNKKSSIVAAAKATLAGGVLFLIPGFLAVFLLGKVFNLLRSVATRLGPLLGIESRLGGLLLDAATIVAILLACFLAGLLARRSGAKRLRNKMDQVLLATLPGYAFIKGVAENMQQSQEIASSFVPVLVKFDDYWQMAFETDRKPDGIVAIYLPGAPNPWSGSVIFVLAERVRKLPLSATDALKTIRTLGRGAEALAGEFQTLQGAR
jgi:uncharacterized membrane protein